MWSIQNEILSSHRGLRYSVQLNSSPASFLDAIKGWKDDRTFRSLFSSTLAQAPYSAFRWETPPVTLEIASQPFEFVLLDSPFLDRRPDPDPFADHFMKSPQKDVLVFPNLGGDAILIVPVQKTNASAYGHLAAFARKAPETQQHSLWKMAAATMIMRLEDGRPVWLSTAGGGVSWLHVRLDDMPKYYGYGPYRQLPPDPDSF